MGFLKKVIIVMHCRLTFFATKNQTTWTEWPDPGVRVDDKNVSFKCNETVCNCRDVAGSLEGLMCTQQRCLTPFSFCCTNLRGGLFVLY